jgi:hypothetical protein
MPYSLLEDRAVLGGVEQAQRRLVDRRALDRVEGHLLHQLLQPLGDRALAAAHRAQQVEDLLLLLQPLRGMAEVAHHLLDGVFHAVELGEGRVDLDDLVGEQPATGAGRCACRRLVGSPMALSMRSAAVA